MRNVPRLPTWLTFALAMALSVVLLQPVLGAQQPSGVISGTVTGFDNKPFPGVVITITTPDDKSVLRTTVTDVKGRYEISELPPGTFVVTAELPGFRTTSRRQNLGSSRREVWLVLEPGPLQETVTVPGPVPPIRLLPLQRQ